MATDIYMPLMGLTMSEGTVVRWLKATGDPVKKGESVLEIETDKATMELEAPSDGFLGNILVGDGTTVPVGTVLSHVLASGEKSAEIAVRKAESNSAQPSPSDSSKVTPLTTNPQSEIRDPKSKLLASPLARRVAAEHSLDLAEVEASGPGGRIVVADVRFHLDEKTRRQEEIDSAIRTRSGHPPQSAIQSPNLQSPISEITPMSSVRRLIAQRMTASQQTAVHVTLMAEAEATGLASWRASLKARGEQVSYNDLLVAIVAAALRQHPIMMTQITADGQLSTPSQINIGLAVDTPRGLLVPVLRDIGNKGVVTIANQAKDLVERTRNGKSTPDELSGGSFTISNLGMYDIDLFTPMINLPECAILGVGRIAEQPVVRDGQVVARLMVGLSLSFDHRIVDGAPAARFLQRIKQLIEQPLSLLD
ncbi:MAG: dihydrolipoamide acetyltransferase family protein [Caldilineaceae bacterium]